MKRFYFPIGATLYALGFGAFALGHTILGWAFLAIPLTFIFVNTIRGAIEDYRKYDDKKFLATPIFFVVFIASVLLIYAGGTPRVIGSVIIGLGAAAVLGFAWFDAIRKGRKDPSRLP